LILNTDNAKKIETNEEGESIDLIGKEKWSPAETDPKSLQ
jgi:hypothetical protein